MYCAGCWAKVELSFSNVSNSSRTLICGCVGVDDDGQGGQGEVVLSGAGVVGLKLQCVM